MTLIDACTLLGVDANAGKPEIRRAFKQMAQKYHPDRYRTLTLQAWATRKFQRLVTARDLLLNRDQPFTARSTTPEEQESAASTMSMETSGFWSVMEAIGNKLGRFRRWFFSHVANDPFSSDLFWSLAILLAFGSFRLLIWALKLPFFWAGLRAGPAEATCGRVVHLAATMLAALLHLLVIYWFGGNWSGYWDSANGMVVVFFVGLPIILFMASELISFSFLFRAHGKIGKELMQIDLN